jgi:outer membrane receptor for ferrienterochelin and colicin
MRRKLWSQAKLPATFFAATLVFLTLPAAVPGQNASSTNDQNGNSTDLASLDIEQLMNVQITTASLFDKVSKAPSIVSVITSDEFRRFAAMTLGEILQCVPGLTGTSQYFTDRSMVAALGDQTKTARGPILFLINGRPTREVQEGGIISDLWNPFPWEYWSPVGDSTASTPCRTSRAA